MHTDSNRPGSRAPRLFTSVCIEALVVVLVGQSFRGTCNSAVRDEPAEREAGNAEQEIDPGMAQESWARENGAIFAKVRIAADAQMPQSRVLELRESVGAGDVLLSIPFNLSLTSDWGDDLLLKVCTDVCSHVCRRVYRYACRPACRHACRHARRHVCRRLCTHVCNACVHTCVPTCVPTCV